MSIFRMNFLAVDVYFTKLKQVKVNQIKAYDTMQFLGKAFVVDRM